MTMHETGADDHLEAGLSGFFAAGLQHPVAASPELLARVLADGLSLQPEKVLGPVRKPDRKAWLGGWRWQFASLGGWGAVTGLVSASIAGLWLGISPPGQMAPITDSVLGIASSSTGTEVDQIELLPNFETLLTEG